MQGAPNCELLPKLIRNATKVRLPIPGGAGRGGGRLRPAVVRGLRQQPAQVSGDSGAVPCEGVPRLRCRRGSVLLPTLAGAGGGGGRLRPAVVCGLRQQPAQVSGDSGAIPCEGVPRLRCRRGRGYGQRYKSWWSHMMGEQADGYGQMVQHWWSFICGHGDTRRWVRSDGTIIGVIQCVQAIKPDGYGRWSQTWFLGRTYVAVLVTDKKVVASSPSRISEHFLRSLQKRPGEL
ncbi:hypothetical protein HNY73_006666 [Argiope bruennichi]|uniref:Uncharacterized protein n=1 Tax=Argiope bruennichi TaxID=94029 RepID=A0A8T0FE22_ARGBR|nr:hypothetical protein HNY73_006666 [Argiope bruennichi]